MGGVPVIAGLVPAISFRKVMPT